MNLKVCEGVVLAEKMEDIEMPEDLEFDYEEEPETPEDGWGELMEGGIAMCRATYDLNVPEGESVPYCCQVTNAVADGESVYAYFETAFEDSMGDSWTDMSEDDQKEMIEA